MANAMDRRGRVRDMFEVTAHCDYLLSLVETELNRCSVAMGYQTKPVDKALLLMVEVRRQLQLAESTLQMKLIASLNGQAADGVVSCESGEQRS